MKIEMRRFAQRLLSASLRICPANSREWLTAMATEMNAVEGEWDAVRWALGAVSVATKCRIWGTLAVAREEIAMNRASVIVVLISVAVVGLLCSSASFRQATGVAPATVRLVLNKPELSDARLRSIAIVAEQQHDADALAFVAMLLSGPQERLAVAKRAIALNPSLTWVLYFVMRNGRLDPAYAQIPNELIAWDPDNALPYLLSAEWSRNETHLGVLPNSLRHEDLSPSEAQWQSLMQQAFSAPRYDDYLNRRFLLVRKVMLEYGIQDPILVAFQQVSVRVPDQANIWSYARVLLRAANPQARQTVQHFGEKLMESQTLIGYLTGYGMRYEALASLHGSPESQHLPPLRNDVDGRFFLVAARAVQIGLFVAIIAVVVLITDLGVLAFRRSQPLVFVRRMIPISAIVLLLSALVTFGAYIPFTATYDRYLHAHSASEAAYALMPFLSFAALPSRLKSPFATPQGRYYLWWIVACAGAAIALWRGARLLRQPMSPANQAR